MREPEDVVLDGAFLRGRNLPVGGGSFEDILQRLADFDYYERLTSHERGTCTRTKDEIRRYGT
eukprot:CAMPEP_0178718492 /NCGR_PEP_ID=MMETSP0699-20121125/22559_1 /TAXON_ID=265572 /ORGANISM="Extubocellulus spinifer, Strain CCMP396" /LENGTH=62 /DNA_ID=CAMNT_0020368543 /DNA_START=1 /DNA_END=189 /DNA_ORIENTATION=-